MYSQMNCLIENEYIQGTSPPQKKTRMYSQMNCLIENDYIKGTFQKNKKSPMYSQMNCLIENEYIQWTFLEGFSIQEIDHLSLIDFFAIHNFSVQDLEFGTLVLPAQMSLEGFRKGLRKGSTSIGSEKHI